MSETKHAEVIVYSTKYCPYCIRAKSLLNKKQVSFQEIDLDKEPLKYDEMADKTSGQTSVPQIFIDDRHVGGCDDMYALEAKGELDPLLFPEN